MKKYVHILIVTVVLLLASAFRAEAAQGVYHVNTAEHVLDRDAADIWAIGADGAALFSLDSAYALTANGLVSLGGSETGNNVYEGGGGLRYDDGSVRVAADKVKVGLRYYFSENRDSSLERAYLENAAGAGYAFGYYDENRRFVQYDAAAVTAETQIDMRPLGGTGVGVYATLTDELLWSVDSTGAGAYLAVHPLSADGEAVTWFKGLRYYGDFAYADLGNGKLTVVNIVDMEHYAMGVIAAEMGAGFPQEALKAQAVAARSYAMYDIYGGIYAGACGFDLTADDYSQVYIGFTDSELLISAVRDTQNQYLTYNGRVIEALFSAADGGETLNSEDVFSNVVPYLRGFDDPYEAAAWTRGALGHRVGLSQWGAFAMAKYYNKNYKDILGFYYTGVGLSYGYL